jgi:hypothetical protein
MGITNPMSYILFGAVLPHPLNRGWILTLGAVMAAVAVAYQVVAPQISSVFQVIGGPCDVGLTTTADGTKNEPRCGQSTASGLGER